MEPWGCRGTGRRRASAWALALLVLASAGCGDDGDDGAGAVDAPPTTEVPGGPLPAVGADLDARVAEAVERARAFLEDRMETIPAEGLFGLDLLARRYDDPLIDPDRTIEEMRARLEADGRIDVASIAIALRVMGDATILDEIDVPDSYGDAWYYLRALACEERPLDDGWVAANEARLVEGGYATTHVLLGLRWADEVGCETPDLGDLPERADAALGAIIERGDRPDVAVTLEAAAFRSYATDWTVPPEVAELALQAQRPDGGWPERVQDAESHWHATALGLWVLLAHQQPDAPDTSWVREP